MAAGVVRGDSNASQRVGHARCARGYAERCGLLLSLVGVAPLGAMAQTYTYDAIGRVSTVVQPNGAKTIYYYDNADNRTVTQTATNGTTTATPPANSPVIWVTQASNLYTLAQNIGYNVSSAGSYTFIVPAGVTIVGGSNGGYAVETGSWPSGSVIALIVNGTLVGGGGGGGMGACYSTSNTVVQATAGNQGGDAISVHYAVTITVNSGAVLNGGGGGGGGGGVYGQSDNHGGSGGGCGGGGGGGGGAGAAGTPGVSQSFPGGAGGAAGYAVRKNGYTAPVTNGGTINGSVG